MDVQLIVGELLKENVIRTFPTSIDQPTGGTVSKVYVLDNTYVIKANLPQMIKVECEFLRMYQSLKLFPRVLYISPTCDYMVYSYIKGTVANQSFKKREVLKVLVEEVINHYTPGPKEGAWGWVDDPVNTWKAFLLNEIAEASALIGSRLKSDEHQAVKVLVGEVSCETIPYVIHGDLGFHNLIFSENQLSGVIDPTPVLGDPLYDLIYAFCSTPEDLTKETLDGVVSFLNKDHKKDPYRLYGKVLIGLYLRLAACLKHHPKDMETYLKAWTYWLNMKEAYLNLK
ncbi:phosphotransferase family protein [Alkalihalobacillus sp. NPDC078783]